MTLQTALQKAIACLKIDSQILHQIVHEDDQTTVLTEGGTVKSVAKAIRDIENRIQAELTNLGDLATQMEETINKTQNQTERAKTYAQNAQDAVKGLTLPNNLAGHAGNLLAVKQDEKGYEFVRSKTAFYGLRKEGANLIAETGEGIFDASLFPIWVLSPPGVTFSLDEQGHLLINI